jgi:hypothetical protein
MGRGKGEIIYTTKLGLGASKPCSARKPIGKKQVTVRKATSTSLHMNWYELCLPDHANRTEKYSSIHPVGAGLTCPPM